MDVSWRKGLRYVNFSFDSSFVATPDLFFFFGKRNGSLFPSSS